MIETTEAGTMIAGREDVMRFHRLRCAHALALEINTGMRMSSRGSVMNSVRELIASPKRTKRGVLRDLVDHMVEHDDYTPSGSIVKALSA